MATLPPPPMVIGEDDPVREGDNPSLAPVPPMGGPGLPVPPGAGLPTPPTQPEDDPSFWDRIKPYLPGLVGSAVTLAAGGKGGMGAFGAGLAKGGGDVALQQIMAQREREYEQEKNTITNVHKVIQEISSRGAFGDPMFQTAVDQYNQAMADGKLTGKEAAKIHQQIMGLGDLSGKIREHDDAQELTRKSNIARAEQRIKAEEAARARDAYGVPTDIGGGEMVNLTPDELVDFKVEMAKMEAAARRGDRSAALAHERMAQQLQMFEAGEARRWASLNIPQGTQDQMTAMVNNYRQFGDLEQKLKTIPTQGPILGRVTLAQAQKLGGAGLDPQTMDVVNRIQRLVAEQAFEKGGKVLTPTELEIYSQNYVPSMNDTIQQAMVKSRNALAFLKNAYATRMSVMPPAMSRLLPPTIEAAQARAVESFGATPGAGLPPPPGDPNSDPLGILTP